VGSQHFFASSFFFSLAFLLPSYFHSNHHLCLFRFLFIEAQRYSR
jgi:hypothetical protein